MELVIDKNDLQNLLKKAISATEKKSALPILSNFLLEARMISSQFRVQILRFMFLSLFCQD